MIETIDHYKFLNIKKNIWHLVCNCNNNKHKF